MKNIYIKILTLCLFTFNLMATDVFYASVYNKDSWITIDNGRYGKVSIQATSVNVGHDVLEVAKLSLDCGSKDNIVPNFSFAISSNSGCNNVKWWDKVGGTVDIMIDGNIFTFGRTTYTSGDHPFMIMDKKYTEIDFINNLKKTSSDITIRVLIGLKNEIHTISISSKDFLKEYKKLQLECKLKH